MKIVVLDGYALNPGDLSWKDFEQFERLQFMTEPPIMISQKIIPRIGEAEVSDYQQNTD